MHVRSFAAPLLAAVLASGGAFVRPGAGAQAAPDPAVAGAFTPPFEEGGAAVPRCQRVADGTEDGYIVCKPVAASSVVLPDGRVLYWNGIEGSENVDYGLVPELAEASRDSRGRVLDLRSGTPTWSDPGDGDAVNPNIRPGRNELGEQDPFGVAGVPGRPGDGLVGSTVGSLPGQPVPAQEPSSSPDDAEDNDGDMFCSYPIQLADGRLIVFGGTDWYNEPDLPDTGDGEYGVLELEGTRNTRVYDHRTGTWSQAGHMKYGRWYPSGVTLSDGKVLVMGGVTKLLKNTQGSNVRRTETFDPSTLQWSENYTGAASENSLPLYPRIHLMPNGKVFYDGNGQAWTPFGQAADEATWGLQQFFNTATKQWETAGLAQFGARSGALDVLLPLRPPYDRATVLVAGGVLGATPGAYVAVPFTEEITVTKSGAVSSARKGDLVNRRWFSQGVALADGTVLAVNGGDVDEVLAPGTEVPVLQAEIYDPAKGTWTGAASLGRGRTYHNSAVLLADGRVLVGGHSPIASFYGTHRDARPGNNNDKDPSFQVYSPPYLFRGERPRIEYAPAGVGYGSTFNLTTPHADTIESVLLVRLPSTTHVLDNDQRSVFLPFSRTSAGTLAVTAPPDGVTAPPGSYMLFVNQRTAKGPVPSVARIVNVGMPDVREALQPYPDDAPAPSVGLATPLEDSTLHAPGDCPGCAATDDRSAHGHAHAPVVSGAVESTNPQAVALRERPAVSRRPATAVPAAAAAALLVTVAGAVPRRRRTRSDRSG